MPDPMRPQINFQIDKSQPVPNPQLLTGSIKITVNGTVLTRVTRADAYDGGHQWNPEYFGTLIRSDIINLANVAVDLLEGDVARYEILNAPIESTPLYLAVERLSDEYLRLAFRVRETKGRPGSDIPPECARGYLVETTTFCQAVLNACQDFFATAAELDLDPDHHSLDGLRSLMNTIEREVPE